MLQVVRKTLNLVASVPRIVRYGDEFSCGVVMSASIDATVLVRLAKYEGGIIPSRSTLSTPTKDVTQRTVQLLRDQPHEVTFSFWAIDVSDVAVLTITAEITEITNPNDEKAKAAFDGLDLHHLIGVRDGIETNFSVLPTQDPVLVATSMAVVARSEQPTVGFHQRLYCVWCVLLCCVCVWKL